MLVDGSRIYHTSKLNIDVFLLWVGTRSCRKPSVQRVVLHKESTAMKLSKAVALASAFSLGIAISLLSLVALLEDGKNTDEHSDRFSSLRLGQMFGRNSSNIAMIAPVTEQISKVTTKSEVASETATISLPDSTVETVQDTAKAAVVPKASSNIRSVPIAKDPPALPAVVESSVSESKAEVQVFSSSITKAPVPTQSCNRTFAPKCEIYPYVQFWNKVMAPEDCYQSPLRHRLGAKASPEELKYVVFMPDGGGWNNIRMAAETAMIFAHATGRY
jgi:hypothetical protein